MVLIAGVNFDETDNDVIADKNEISMMEIEHKNNGGVDVVQTTIGYIFRTTRRCRMREEV
uniref:Uncharacterized protein n=1 Tax=Romanomermis culicivorax TaxID=13658 RepID=A0A915IG15_ROMCU